MFDHSSNISPCDFAEVCPEVSLFESENFEFEDVVPFNVSADRLQVFVKGKLFKSIGIGFTFWSFQCAFYFYQVIKTTGNPLEVTGDLY